MASQSHSTPVASDGEAFSQLRMVRRLAPLYLVIVVGPLNTSGAFNLVPVFADDFSVSVATASLAITLYMLPFVVTQVFSGAVTELIGPTRALVAGFVVFSASSVGAFLAPTFEVFLAVRMLQGLGGGIILPVSMAMAAGQVPPNRTATAIGGIQGAFAGGLALGPGVAGLFAEHLGWQSFYVFLAVVGFASAVLVGVAYPLRRAASAARRSPLAPLRQAFTIGGVRVASLMGFMLSFAGVGVSIYIAVWLQRDSGLTGPAGAGLILSVPGTMGIFVAPVAGWLGDRWGVSRAIVVGMSFTVAGLAGIFAVPHLLWAFPPLLFLTGVGNTSTTTNLGALSLMSWPQIRQAVSGVFNAARYSGLALAPLALAPVYAAFSLRGVLVVAVALLATTALLLRASSLAKSPTS